MFGNKRERRFGKITLGTLIATFLLLGLGVPIPPAVCLFAIAGANIAGGVQANKRMSENNGSKSKSTNNENNSLKNSKTKIHNKKNKTANNMSIKDSDKKLHKENINTQNVLHKYEIAPSMDNIKFQKRFNPNIDEEFGDVGRYQIIEEFEDLLPMYPFGNDGAYTWKFIIENKFEITNTSGKALFDIIGDDNVMIKNQAEEFRRMDLL